MEMCLKLIALLCVSTGLWIGADACKDLVEEACKACPAGWFQYESSCYQFHHSKMDWADAEKHCTTLGANLISLHSKAQHTFIQNTLRSTTGTIPSIWVGGYDSAKNNVWLWSDGSSFDFLPWTKGEPNNAGGVEGCIMMNYGGIEYTFDMVCSTKSSFFCAKAL